MSPLLITSLQQGLIFAILSMGVFITYKILDFPDLSVEGSFPLGAFIFAKLTLIGINPLLGTLLAGLLSSLTGLLTYNLHIKLKIQPILAGILTMTILYSVNLRIHEGRSNISLYNQENLLSLGNTLIILGIIVIIVKLLLDNFMDTKLGYLLIATGDNPTLVKSLGQNPNKLKMIGLMISNGAVGLSGALMSQSQTFADITMGSSIIVVALASIIIGDSFMRNSTKLKGTTRAIIGAISYKLIGALALTLGLAPTDLKGVSALIVILFIGYNNLEIGDKIQSLFKIKRSPNNVRNGKLTQNL